jgi:hypothetical protein
MASVAVILGGCGYQDQDPQAVRVVAQAFVSAYPQRDPTMICTVVIPPLAAQFASLAHGSCEQHIASTFTPHEPVVRLGAVKVSGGSATVDVVGQPGHNVDLIKYGSLWAVTASWELR